MSQLLQIHPQNPQPRLVRQVGDILRAGGVIACPTDSCYALGCGMAQSGALERIRRLRNVEDDHNFTLLCRDLSELSTYAKVDNAAYRALRAHTPGPYTFILNATREVPRRLQHAKRKTIGLRVPETPMVSALLMELGEPMMSVTLFLAGETLPPVDSEEIYERLGRDVDVVIGAGDCGFDPTSVIDLTGPDYTVLRRGRGDVSAFDSR